MIPELYDRLLKTIKIDNNISTAFVKTPYIYK